MEGNEICLGSQSGGGETGMSTFIKWLDCRCCCGAGVSVVLLLVMSRLLPTTLAIKMNEKNYLRDFSSETDMCIPGESLKTLHPESVFSHSGDRKGEGEGLALDLFRLLIQNF